MSKKYPEYESLNLPAIAEKILKEWDEENIFAKSISTREGKDPFVFYDDRARCGVIRRECRAFTT